jgi:hypothetical protein
VVLSSSRLPVVLRRVALRVESRLEGLGNGFRAAEPPPWPGPATTLPPVFVGGSGRSGTTITGRLVGAHSAYKVLSIEVRFISDPGGLVHLAEGATSFRRFSRRIRNKWYTRREGHGLHRILEREAIEGPLEVLRQRLARDRWLAGRAYAHELLDRFALAADARGWVEQSPTNTRVAAGLVRMFPGARVIHVVRDGRDVACSLVRQPWGPNDFHSGLEWWARRYRYSAAALAAAPPDSVLTFRMEDLMDRDREGTFGGLLAFLGLDEDEAIRSYFDGTVTRDKAHIGRWRTDVPADERPAFEAHYERLLADLERAGWAGPLAA